VLTHQRTQTAFTQFIQNRDQQFVANSLVQYYLTNGSWAGVTEDFIAIVNATPLPQDARRDFRRELGRYTLVGQDHTVAFSVDPNRIGQPVSNQDLDRAIPLLVNNTTVGWLFTAPLPRDLTPNSPEGLFIRSVDRASMISALVAVTLALTLGGLLAFTMTRSLRELTEATVEIAKGKLGLQVKVRSKDEIGELATSFNQMSLGLARATQARRQMTADIAHDLRTPLSVIAGYAEALGDGKLPGTPEIYGILHQETQYLSRLVEDLRTLSLADAGELPLTLQIAQPRSILDQVAARYAVAAEGNGVSLRVEKGQELPNVNIDVERIAQVFDNLVTNALRHTPEGGEIVLAARAEDGTVQLQVRDNGSGVAPEDLPYLFDRFYRGDKSRQASGESGLGLAIAKSIIEAHGGTISVESVLGQGAAFTILLPAG
jgi:two-component system sensor histidine kinase BaeS